MSNITNDDKIMGGFAKFGRIQATFGAVLGTIVGVIFIIAGIFMIYLSATSQTRIKIVGKITEVDGCTTTGRRKRRKTSCEIKVKYMVRDEEFFYDTVSNKVKNPGDSFDIFLDSLSTPELVHESDSKQYGASVIAILLGMCIIFVSNIDRYLTRKSDTYAQFSGMSGAMNMF